MFLFHKNIQQSFTILGPLGSCPEKYVYFAGSCYMYEQWVLRHYQPESYTYQTTWLASEQRCQSENASLVTIKDLHEAEFIKVGQIISVEFTASLTPAPQVSIKRMSIRLLLKMNFWAVQYRFSWFSLMQKDHCVWHFAWFINWKYC